MTFKTLARIGLTAMVGLGALSAYADSTAPIQNYHYGQHLDVKKVLAIHDHNADGCGVVMAEIDYLDSKGKPHNMQYESYATGACHDGG